MSGFAHPCPDCGCGGDCVICESPNEAVDEIIVTFTVSGVVTEGGGGPGCCETDANATFMLTMDRLTGNPTLCYQSATTTVDLICGFSAYSCAAFISQPNMSGESTLTIQQTNGATGTWTAETVLTLPIDCSAFGPVTMTITATGTPVSFDICDATGVSVDVSLSV